MPQSAVDSKDTQAVQALMQGSVDEAAYRLAERLTEDVVSRMSSGASKPNQQAVELLMVFFKDTVAFIVQSHKAKGGLNPAMVRDHLLEKHQNFLHAVGFDHAACGLAVAHLITTLATTVPVMAMETKAVIVTGGIAVYSGGLGVPFVLGSTALLALSGLSLYLSATQTAEVCSMTMSELADRYGQAVHAPPALRARATQRLRCEVPVNQFTPFVLGLVTTALARAAPPPRFTPMR